MEDLELEHERDDDIVQDHGFAARSSWAQRKKKLAKLRGHKKPSNEVANGDKNEDLDLEDERDPKDDIVADTGFASRSSWAAQKKHRALKKHAKAKKHRKPSNEVANGDKNEDLDLEDERDPKDDIVADTGFASRSSWAQKKSKHLKYDKKSNDHHQHKKI